MKIRKHWKKLLLTLTALFWASCSSDNDSNVSVTNSLDNGTTPDASIDTGFTGAAVVLYGVPSDTIIDTIYVEDSIYTESSSGTVQSSSSKITGYGTYKLARDTSITCEVSETQTFIMGSGRQSPDEIMDNLENNETLSVEELNELEDKLEFESLGYGTLYGVPSVSTGIKPSKYSCSNGSTYSASIVKGRDGILYTNKEYEEKFPTPVPSPLCQKTGFMSNGATEELGVNKERFVGDMIVGYNTDRQALVDSAKAASGEALSEAQKQCLDRDITTISAYSGPIASKQICDGDTTANPRYQAKLDSNKAYIQKQINNCLKEPE